MEDEPKNADARDGGGPGEETREEKGSEFARKAEEAPPGFLAEFLDFLLHNKKWWLAPIFIVLLLVGFLILLGGSSAAPFIYALF